MARGGHGQGHEGEGPAVLVRGGPQALAFSFDGLEQADEIQASEAGHGVVGPFDARHRGVEPHTLT